MQALTTSNSTSSIHQQQEQPLATTTTTTTTISGRQFQELNEKVKLILGTASIEFTRQFAPWVYKKMAEK